MQLWGLTALQAELNGSCEQASGTGKLFLPWLKLQNLGLNPSSLKAVGTLIASSFRAMKKDAMKWFWFFLIICLTAETAALRGGFCAGS